MILLTGSTGLLGGHTLYALLQKHERVAALKREGSSTETLREIFSYYTNHPEALMDRIDWRSGDMLDAGSLVRAMEGISCVVNCAAIVSFDPKDRNMLIRNNVIGTKNLVNAMLKEKDERLKTKDNFASRVTYHASRYPILIHISSTAALGDSPGNDPKFRINEETPRDPKRQHNGYSESKWQSEEVVWNAIEGHEGIRAVILNPGIILGPGQWTKGSSQLFRQAWEGLKFYPYGGTGYVDVRDVAEIVVKIVERWKCGNVLSKEPITLSHFHIPQLLMNQRYCVVGANLRFKEFFDKVTDEFGKPNPYIFAGKFLAGIAWRADTLKARLLGRYPLLTRDTAESAQRISFYSSEKIQQTLDFKFRPIEETLDWICSLYKTKRLRD
jgi:nucleoside-diphosphate-sugar epimerase